MPTIYYNARKSNGHFVSVTETRGRNGAYYLVPPALWYLLFGSSTYAATTGIPPT